MAKAGDRLREQAKRQRRLFLRENWRLLLAGLGILTGTAVFCAVFWWFVAVPRVGVEHRQLVTGFLGGVIVSSYGWAIAWVLREVDGTGSLRRASEAEVWTSEALQGLGRHGWYVIDNVAFAGYDVDHVAVGPPGVYVFETKQTSFPWKITEAGLVGPYRDPVKQACFGAKRISQLLRSKGVDVSVTPVIAVWGGRMEHIDGGARVLPGVDGAAKVTVVSGRQQKEWVARMASAPVRVEPGTVEAVREVLQDFKVQKAALAVR